MGKTHDFLEMNFDFREPKMLTVDVCGHVDNVVDTFQIEFDKDDESKHPSGDRSFDKGTGESLDQKDEAQFHTTTAKGSCISKRARPDLQLSCEIVVQQSTPIMNKQKRQTILKLKFRRNGTG